MQFRIILITILSLIVTLQPAFAGPVGQAGEGETYVVQADDWLSKIADKFYGETLAYPAIVAATNLKAAEDSSFARIDKPDLIEVGQSLWIPAQISGQPLTLDMLKNAQYTGIYDDPALIQLGDGRYAGEPFVPGGASRPTVTLLDERVAFGDLNGDGLEDAAVLLVENSGGSGAFLHLAAVINQNGVPLNVATEFIGDRNQIEAISIDEGTITLEGLSHAADDPQCCPTVPTTLTYRLTGDRLVDPAQQVVGVYKGFFIAASSPGRDSTIYLNGDQTARLVTDYLNDDPVLEEVGTWTTNDTGQVVVTLTGQADRTYDTPVTMVLTLADGVLTEADTQPGQIVSSWIEISELAIGRQPVPYDPTGLDQIVADRGFIGYYKAYLPSASCCGRDITLLLGIDQMAEFKTDFLNGEPPIVEVGRWETTADKQVVVTLTGRSGQPYDTPTQITFAWIDHMLIAVDHDPSQFGSAGLSFYHSDGLLASIKRP